MSPETPVPRAITKELQVLSREDKDELVHLHYLMLLIRRFEEKTAEMYTRAKIGGFVHLNIGEEASIVGAVSALAPQDYLFTAYRDHGWALARGCDPKATMAELFGKATGLSKGRGGSMHLFDAGHRFLGGYAIVGGPMPVATGAAFAVKYRGGDEVVMCQIGEGATNIGAFHEALNLASLWKLPAVFVATNNLYGMGTAVNRASSVSEIYRKACAYDMSAERVDGMDVLLVREAVTQALRRAREQKEPTLLELLTYRYRGHSMADPARYRSDDEVKWWRERDPIDLFRRKLMQVDAITLQDVGEAESEANRVVRESVEFAELSPEPGVEDLGLNVLA
ncbi:MAG: pyruvate dehydrogenase (acetyl-transferring) E1 component subunit alpha [Chloroflexi bacterium]|nr:pyruvate dehydrogenase (acetyl-transferring) E1 component subunit alpha [Chloroflexota bacterium]